MSKAIVEITGEWFPDREAGGLRVPKGIYPECRVDGVPVLVIWGGSEIVDNEKMLRAFREIVGVDGALVVAGPENGEGWIHVDTTLSSSQRVAAMIASAVAKVSWGWDEHRVVRISDDLGPLLVAVDFIFEERCFHTSIVISASETLHAFFDRHAAARWSFDRKDGVHCEGHVLELETNRVLFGYGGPLAPKEPEWIPFDRIGVDKLSYWDERAKRWVDW